MNEKQQLILDYIRANYPDREFETDDIKHGLGLQISPTGALGALKRQGYIHLWRSEPTSFTKAGVVSTQRVFWLLVPPRQRLPVDHPRRNDDALHDSRPLTDGEKMAVGDWAGIKQERGDSMG